MKHTTKRLMALLLAAVMLLGLLPAAALAAPGESSRAGETTINVTDYGADPTGARESSTAVKAALAAAKKLEGQAVTISFPKGEYHFYADKSEVRTIYVSNTIATNQTYKNKHLGILVEDMENVTIDGNGSQFIYHGDMTAFATIRSQNVTFQNFSVDSASPSVIDVTVESLDAATTSAILYVPSCYTYEIRNGNSIHWTVEGDNAHSGDNNLRYQQGFNTITGVTTRGPGNLPFSNVSTIEQVEGDPTRLKVTYTGADKLPTLGMCFQMRNTIRTTPGTLFWESADVTVQNLNIQFLHGFGMVGQLSENITLDTVKFEARPGTGRTSAGFADFVQMSSIAGKVIIRNCDFSNPHDDPINVHGTFMKVTEVSNENKTFKLRYMHSETAGFPQYHVNDKVDFTKISDMTNLTDSERTVVAVENPPLDATDDETLRTITITLDRPVEGIVANQYAVENVTYTPEVLIENCRFTETPTRGILCTTRKKVVIQNNYFDRMGSSSIFISSDARIWYESGYASDVLIKGNTFIAENTTGDSDDYGGSAIIMIWPTNNSTNNDAAKQVHKNITIEDNTFHILPMAGNKRGIVAKSVDGLTIKNNRFLRYQPNVTLTLGADEASLAPGETRSTSLTTSGTTLGNQLYRLKACKNVVMEGNVYDDGLNLGVQMEGSDIAAADVNDRDGVLTVGGSNQLDAVGTVTYYSDKPEVATVDANGVITGVSAGTANITAFRTVAGRTFESNALAISVDGTGVTPPDKIEIVGASTVDVGGTLTLTATVDNVAWAVKPLTEGAAATITTNGVLTATAPGVVEVTASKGGVTASKLVTVKVPMWSVVNPSGVNGAVTVSGDGTRLTLKCTSTGGDFNPDGAGAQDRYLMDTPAGDFSVSVKMETRAKTNWQEAGLVIFKDADHYVNMTSKSRGGSSTWLALISENGDRPGEPHITQTAEAIWVKLERTGTTFKGYYRVNESDEWTQFVKTDGTGSDTPTNDSLSGSVKVGLYASNSGGTQTDYSFSDFKLNDELILFNATAPVPSVSNVVVNPDTNTHAVMLDYRYNSYSDADSDAESGTLFAWYVSDTDDGHYTRIEGANTPELAVTAATSEKWVKAVVIPRDATGRYGAPVTSSRAVQAPKAPTVENDATLSSLSVTGLTLTPAFDPKVTQYTVNIPAAVDRVTVNATATQARATVTGTGEVIPTGATATVNVYVFAPNNKTNKTYTITIHRARSSDVTLKAFTASDNEAVSAINYDPAIRFYGLVVPENATHLSWSLTAPAGATVKGRYNGEDKGAVGGNGFWPLKPGLNHLELRVTAEDGISTALYRVRVLKPNASSNAELTSLRVDDITVLPGSMMNNEAMVRLDGNTATIRATPTSEKSTVHISVNGKPVENHEEVNLTQTVSTATVRVVAEDGVHESVYTVTLIKKDPTSAELYKLDLGKVALSSAFDAYTENYTAVNYGNLSTTLNAAAAQMGATITYETVDDYAVTQDDSISKPLNFYKGDGLKEAEDGKTYNTVIVTVTSPDGSRTKTYTVKVEIVEEVYLSDLNWMDGSSAGDTGWNGGMPAKDLSWESGKGNNGVRPIKLTDPEGSEITFAKGIGTHANSYILYDLSDMGFTTFTAKVGVSYYQHDNGNPNLYFEVECDGVNSYSSGDYAAGTGAMVGNTPYKTVSVNIDDVDKLELIVRQKDHGISNAHGNWADAKLSSTITDIANKKDILIKYLKLEKDAYTVYANTTHKDHTVELQPVVKPIGAALSGRQSVLTWTPDDPTIATAGQGDLHQGIITGQKAGETTVTVTNPAKTLTATCNVTVKWELAGKVSVAGGPSIGSTLSGALNQLDQGAKGNVDIQWWRKGANDNDFAEIAGANEKDYTVAIDKANVGAQYKVVVTAKEGTYYDGTSESDPITMTKAAADNMQTDPTPVPCTNEDTPDGKLTGLHADRRYQWQKQNDDGFWPDEWTDVTEGATSIDGLSSGNYRVRRWFDPDTYTPGSFANVHVGVAGDTEYAVNRDDDDGNGNYVRALPRPAKEGATVTVTVTTATGWELTSLTATNDTTTEEVELTKTEGKDDEYTFEMPASDVTLKPVFAKKTYTITHDLTNITCSLGDEESHTATHGERFTITLTPDEGYEMKPTTITVTNADKNEPFEDYSYLVAEDPAARVLTFEHGVTCNITISGKPDRKTYPVDYSGLTNGLRAPNAPQTATHGQEFAVTLEAAKGYALPETVTVTVGGAEVDAAYDKDSGKIAVSGEKVTGSIAIEAEGVAQDLPLQTVTMVGPARVGRTLMVNIVPVNAQVTYQWYYYTEGEEPTPIENATAAQYDIQEADEGKSICVKVTAVAGSGYTGELTTEPTAAILGETEPFVYVDTVTLDETATVAAGKTVRLTAAVTPENPTSDVLFWSSDNEAIATVDQNGVVTGVAEGVVTITAAATDRRDAAYDTCTVTVTAAETPVRPSRPSGSNSGTTTTKTETREDGTKVTTVTKPNGSVTETVTQPDGTKSETLTTKEGNVTITVTDESGEELVKAEIPATIPEPETKFEDVDVTPWAEEAIHKMAGLELVNGTGGNKYSPVAPMTRGSLATVLHRLSQGKTDYENTFKDVTEGKYYTEGVAWAAKANVVKGISEDIFAPDDIITREQLAVMLARYAKLIGMDTKADSKSLEQFVDGDTTGTWAVDGVAWCVENGILKGKGQNNLDPTTDVTRAEVAVMLDRFIALIK